MKIALIFDPDPDLGPDPDDRHQRPRALGEFIDAERTDVLLLVRRYGEQYEGGCETQVYATGIWESVGVEQVSAAVDALQDLASPE